MYVQRSIHFWLPWGNIRSTSVAVLAGMGETTFLRISFLRIRSE